jgi:hypothetical protein
LCNYQGDLPIPLDIMSRSTFADDTDGRRMDCMLYHVQRLLLVHALLFLSC